MVGGSARYMQRWDENYDKQLGYEWFKICTEYINFPDYNSFSQRLVNIRKAQGQIPHYRLSQSATRFL